VGLNKGGRDFINLAENEINEELWLYASVFLGFIIKIL
jgi:hypothetical protein